MYHEFNCSGCAKRLRVPSEVAGSLTKCPHCETMQIAKLSVADAPIPMAEIATSNPFADDPVNPFRDAPVTSNPYVAPLSTHCVVDELLSRVKLATPILRLAAWILDWLFFIGCVIPGVVMTTLLDGFDLGIADIVGGMILIAGVIMGMAYQWYFISARGQSWGKRLVGVRIVTTNGLPPGFLRGVLLRQWIFIVFAPCYPLAAVVALVDMLMIFTANRQCLHDMIATTYVVKSGGESETLLHPSENRR